jgi:nicotinate-nucleotide pyrophosphorylase (carboxylating)
VTQLWPPPRTIIDETILRALDEDLGGAGDLSTLATIGEDQQATGQLVARRGGTIAGLDVARRVFELLDDEFTVTRQVRDGDHVGDATVLATLSGSARTLLTGERTALNLLGHLSGIATATSQVVAAVAGHDVRVADTRKTTPGLRALEKYAVRCGGGSNHRFGLHDAVLLKDNHLAIAGSITEAVAAARAHVGHTVTIEVEIDRLDQLPEALEAGADVILLDNMDPPTIEAAVKRIAGRAICEASGGITLDTARTVAATGVDILAVGWITHSAPRLDVAIDA